MLHFLLPLLGIVNSQQCGRQYYPMTPGLLQQVMGSDYKTDNWATDKAEWDAPEDLDIPDYEETMIWDPARKRRDSDEYDDYDGEENAEDAIVGNFEHPDFWDVIDSGFTGDRTTGASGEYTGPPIGRIVGGKVAEPYSYPWMVRVRACSGYACTRMCGGTLVGNRAVVTASHCIPPYAQTGLITLGAHEYYGPRAMNVTIQAIHQHPGWNKSTRINDIAVIILAERVTFSKRIQPACLPNKDHCFQPGTACVAAGWGYIKEGGPRSSLLREVPVRMMTRDHCNKSDYYNGRILEGMLCAGYNEGERDACTGDSGGPLVCPLPSGNWVLAGVTSWGVGCARYKRPGVYSNVADFSDWIGSIIKEYPDVVGSCRPNGNGYGFDGDWSWTGDMPPRKPQSELFYHDGYGYGSSHAKPTTTKRTTTPRRTTTRRTMTTKKTSSWASDQQKLVNGGNDVKPFFPEVPGTIDPFAEATRTTIAPSAEKTGPCKGLKGRDYKKCLKKKKKKKSKSLKKKKKTYLKTNEFDYIVDLSKRERRKYIKGLKLPSDYYEDDQDSGFNEMNSVRGEGVTFDSSDAEMDDNQKFAAWDYV